MPRVKKNSEPEPPKEPVIIPELPPRTVNGRANAQHYRARIAEFNDLARESLHNERKLPFNFESYVNGVYKEAELAGISRDDIADTRSDSDKIRDAVDKLTSDSMNARWSTTDEELRLVLRTMVESFHLGQEVLDEWTSAPSIGDTLVDVPVVPGNLENWPSPIPESDGTQLSLGKAWCVRVRQMLRARKLARDVEP